MTPPEAHEVLRATSPLDVGRFYGNKDDLALGAGLIYDRILSPHFSTDERLFLTVKQPVYVITHECDVDPANDRPFNDYVSICPVIPLPAFLKRYSEKWPDREKLTSFLANVAQREVGRVIYLPPGPSVLEHGALVYLNAIASTHISSFVDEKPIAALSEYGLRELDSALRNTILRPKAERLSLAPEKY